MDSESFSVSRVTIGKRHLCIISREFFKLVSPVPIAPELVFQVSLVIILVAKRSFAFDPVYNKTIHS